MSKFQNIQPQGDMIPPVQVPTEGVFPSNYSPISVSGA